MRALQLCIAVVLLFAGHFAKALRWRQFVQIYETTGQGTLIRALACGYLADHILPLHIGDLVRAFWAGRKMENGSAFSLATVILDRCLDVWAIGLICSAIYCGGALRGTLRNAVLPYIFTALALAVLLAVSLRYNRGLRRAARKLCALFNDRIELTLLMFFWSFITVVRDMLTRVDKARLLFGTVCMWTLYLLSCSMVRASMRTVGYGVGFLDVLPLFDGEWLGTSAVTASRPVTGQAAMMVVYALAPLLLLFGASVLTGRCGRGRAGGGAEKVCSLRLLPQARDKDRLRFLESYFDAKDRERLRTYIRSNQNVTILKDYSAGSKATTLLCMDEGGMFYRKYAFGPEADKLERQIRWLESHRCDVPLPEVTRVRRSTDCCCYDMPCHPEAVGLFQHIHSAPGDECWELLRTVLDDLQRTVYRRNVREADPALVQRYIDEKVLANFARLEASPVLEPLLRYETLVINEKEYPGYPALKAWMDGAYLREVFSRDSYADIHGDLTVENIVCMKNGGRTGYYLIDPNMGNVHESPFLDHGKLLQSLHGGYEFLMRTERVEVDRNEIRYLSMVSQRYGELLRRYREYLRENFTREQVRSIYCHELVHWLRLMPYKLQKNGELAAVFFAGMMTVFNDIKDWVER